MAETMTGTASVTNLFETPIIIDQLPQFEALNAGLRQAISDRRQVDAGVRKSNVLGWQSDTLMLRWGGDEARALAGHFISLCDRFTADPRPDDPARPPFLWMPDMWANISPRDAANNYHSHPGAVWSAVYYVDDGYGDGEGAGGELVFADPRMPMTRMLPLDLRFRAPDGAMYQSEHVLRPATGRIVMFPPWLLHCVRPYQGHGERISVAMNATAYQPPPSPAH